MGTPASNNPSGAGGAPGAYTDAGPPDRMMAFGRRASISAVRIVCGTISEYTWHSRTRRAISCAYWAPKSTTRTVSGVSATRPPSSAGERTEPPFRKSPGRASLVGLLAWLLPPVRGDAGRLAHPHPGDPPSVQLGHGQLAAGDLHRLPLARQVAERGQQVARHRLVRALGQLDPGLFGELVEVQQAVDLELAAAQLPGLGLVDVVLVPYLADQLLDQVLEGDDAGGTAVLVHHDGQVRVLAPHLRERGQHRLAGRQELHRPADLAHPHRGALGVGCEQVPGVHEADHVVVGLLVDGEPAVRRRPDDLRRLGYRHGGGQELHLGS